MPRRRSTDTRVPVIDLFAGPGGLSEGFARYAETDWGAMLAADGRRRPRRRSSPGFRVALSVEMEPQAHRTLELRAFFRSFAGGDVPSEYYEHLRGEISRDALFEARPANARIARHEARCAELGGSGTEPDAVDGWILDALGGRDDWVLIGGPPCQAYSIAGRSRNRGIAGYDPARDKRHYLYEEYLRIVAAHRPPVFIMENVKGLLTAEVNGQQIFERILADLCEPGGPQTRSGNEGRYRICSVTRKVQPNLIGVHDPRDYLVMMENHGIPQARHRLILLGIREDLANGSPPVLPVQDPVPLWKVLDGCPRLRSGLSRRDDSPEAWLEAVGGAAFRFDSLWHPSENGATAAIEEALSAVSRLRAPRADRGRDFIRDTPRIEWMKPWFLDRRLDGYCNHASRQHIVEDLYRYLFAAAYGKAHDRSPTLRDFPPGLRPKHRNVSRAVAHHGTFADRFRVQVRTRPATTITSHISKDGHYYIHPDPTQCRSLTVREAARVQTFPDNYLFCGNRTQQYTQVGNAVPPLLATQIADIVATVLNRVEAPV